MAARNFSALIFLGLLALPAAALAADTALSGAELLARCEGTPQLLKSDQLYCKGYLEGIEDYVAELRAQGQAAPFCVPDSGITDAEMRDLYMSWAKANPGGLSQPARAAALAAMADAYPCGQ